MIKLHVNEIRSDLYNLTNTPLSGTRFDLAMGHPERITPESLRGRLKPLIDFLGRVSREPIMGISHYGVTRVTQIYLNGLHQEGLKLDYSNTEQVLGYLEGITALLNFLY